MAEVGVNIWKREKRMNRDQIVRLQIVVHCHLAGIDITPNKLRTMVLIGTNSPCDLTRLCEYAAGKGKLFSSVGSARNTLLTMEKMNLIVKEGGHRKVVKLHPDMKVQTEGNIMVDIKCVSLEPVKS